MGSIRRIVILGLVLILCTFGITLSAKTTDPPTQPDIYDLVVDLGNKLDNVQSDLDTLSSALDTVNTHLRYVSTELGMANGVFFHTDQGGVSDVVVAYVADLARFTVTLTYYQEEVLDHAGISISYDGNTWETLAILDPQPLGGDSNFVGKTTITTTVVARKIRISSYNDIEDLGGNKPLIAWAISAVGSADSPDMVINP